MKFFEIITKIKIRKSIMIATIKKYKELIKTVIIIILSAIVIILLLQGTIVTISNQLSKPLINFVSNDLIATILGTSLGGFFAFITAKYTLENQFKKQGKFEVTKLKFEYDIENIENLIQSIKILLDQSKSLIYLVNDISSFNDEMVNKENNIVFFDKQIRYIESQIDKIDNYFMATSLTTIRLNSQIDLIDDVELKKILLTYTNQSGNIYTVHHFLKSLKSQLSEEISRNEKIKIVDIEDTKKSINKFLGNSRKLVDVTLPKEKKRFITDMKNKLL